MKRQLFKLFLAATSGIRKGDPVKGGIISIGVLLIILTSAIALDRILPDDEVVLKTTTFPCELFGPLISQSGLEDIIRCA